MNSKNKSDNVIFYVEVIFLWTMFVHNKEKYLYYTFENVFLYCHWRFNGSTTKLRNQWCSRNLIYTGMSIYHLKTKCMLYTSFLLDNRKSKDYKLWTSFCHCLLWSMIWLVNLNKVCVWGGGELIDWFLVFNATFSNISAILWRPVLVVEEAGVSWENHRPWASNW